MTEGAKSEAIRPTRLRERWMNRKTSARSFEVCLRSGIVVVTKLHFLVGIQSCIKTGLEFALEGGVKVHFK